MSSDFPTHDQTQNPPPPFPSPPSYGAPPIFQPMVQPAPERKKRTGCALWVLGALALFFFACTALLLVVLGGMVGDGTSLDIPGGPQRRFVEHTIAGRGANKILLVPVEGIIADVSHSDLFGAGGAMVTDVKYMLQAAERDPAVRAVLVEVNSPGGGITASDIIYHELKTFQTRTGKPVVALLDDMAASGGYYVAAAAQRIIAHPTTVTGSIGVIMPFFGVEDLLAKIGVTSRPIKSAPMKDIGSMSREMSPQEKAVLQGITDEYFQRFVSIVYEGFQTRKVAVTREELLKVCDGRIFTGSEALKLGLVDEIGYFAEAVSAVQTTAGLKPETTRVITYRHKPTFVESIFSKADAPRRDAVTIRLDALTGPKTPRFMYLWTAQ